MCIFEKRCILAIVKRRKVILAYVPQRKEKNNHQDITSCNILQSFIHLIEDTLKLSKFHFAHNTLLSLHNLLLYSNNISQFSQ